MNFRPFRCLTLATAVAACGAVQAAPVTYAPGQSSAWYEIQVTGVNYSRAVLMADASGIDTGDGYLGMLAGGAGGSGSLVTFSNWFSVPLGNFPSAYLGESDAADVLDGSFSVSVGYYGFANGTTLDNVRVVLFDGQTELQTLSLPQATGGQQNVPEPGSLALAGLALAAASLVRRRRIG